MKSNYLFASRFSVHSFAAWLVSFLLHKNQPLEPPLLEQSLQSGLQGSAKRRLAQRPTQQREEFYDVLVAFKRQRCRHTYD